MIDLLLQLHRDCKLLKESIIFVNNNNDFRLQQELKKTFVSLSQMDKSILGRVY